MATNIANIQIGDGVVQIKRSGETGYSALGGLSEDGVTLRSSNERVNITVGDADVYVKSVRTRLDVTMTFEVVEATLQALADALGLPKDRVSGGTLTITDEDLGEVAIKFVGEDVDGGELKTIEFPKCVIDTDLEIALQKGGEVRIPFSVLVLGTYDSDLGAWKLGTVSST